MRHLLAAALLIAGVVPATLRAQDVTSVPALDISRYAGEWHEIARLPMYFQRQCRSEVTDPARRVARREPARQRGREQDQR